MSKRFPREKIQSKMNTKPSKTKEEQATVDGWVYVNASKAIRGWNQVWVQEARVLGLGVDEEKARRL